MTATDDRFVADLTDERLSRSIYALRDAAPVLSAERTFLARQRNGLVIGLLVLVVASVLWWQVVLPVLIGIVTLAYLSTIVFRASLLYHAARHPEVAVVPDDVARAVPDDELPVYTVMIPCYKEPEVVGQLLQGMIDMEYPQDKMDIKLLLEADDHATIAEAESRGARRHRRGPRRAGRQPADETEGPELRLQSARGEYVTIFDAEDRPDPLQLRKAAIALAAAPDDIACLQAELAYFNPDQNIITRWFTLEYELWFRQFLPGLSRVSAPIPSAARRTTSAATCSSPPAAGTPSTSPRTPTSACACTGSATAPACSRR